MKLLLILFSIGVGPMYFGSTSSIYGEYYLLYSDVDCIMEKNQSEIKYNLLKDGQGFFEIGFEMFGTVEYEFFGWKAENDTLTVVYHELGRIDRFVKVRDNIYKDVESNYYLVKNYEK